MHNLKHTVNKVHKSAWCRKGNVGQDFLRFHGQSVPFRNVEPAKRGATNRCTLTLASSTHGINRCVSPGLWYLFERSFNSYTIVRYKCGWQGEDRIKGSMWNTRLTRRRLYGCPRTKWHLLTVNTKVLPHFMTLKEMRADAPMRRFHSVKYSAHEYQRKCAWVLSIQFAVCQYCS